MKKFLLFFMILTACKKEIDKGSVLAKSDQITPPAIPARTAMPDQVVFSPSAFYPEGIAWDKFHDRFLVSSFTNGTIGSVTPEGVYTPFIRDAAVRSTLGVHIDEARKQVVAAITDGLFNNIARVGVYDLETGRRIRLVDLAALRPGANHLADDLAIDPKGNIYITDVKSPIIYKVDVDGRAAVFFENERYAEPPGPKPYYWVGFNGIVYNKSGFLLVAFYAEGKLVKIPVDHPDSFTEVQLDTPIVSPDGILISRDGKELAVVDNKYLTYPPEIVRLGSDDQWTTAKRLQTVSTGFTSPTTATTDGKDVYVLSSYLFDVFFGTPFTHTDYMIQKIPFRSNVF